MKCVRLFVSIFMSVVVGSMASLHGMNAGLSSDQHRAIKRDMFFAHLLRQTATNGMLSYSSAQQAEHPNPELYAIKKAAGNVCDASITKLASKSLSRYTSVGKLNKLSYAVGPFSFRGKTITKAVMQSAKIGVTNAAYFRKKYGAWWPVLFSKNVIMPMVLKSVVIGAVAPLIFTTLKIDKLGEWGNNSIIKHELCGVVTDMVMSGIHGAYEWLMPRLLQVEV